MSDTKHTPGPWFVVPLPWDESGCIVNAQTPDPHGGEFICHTDEGKWHGYDDEDIERWRANANLIASAPHLLNTCKRALDYMETYEEHQYPKGRELMDILRQSIARAEGRAPEADHA